MRISDWSSDVCSSDLKVDHVLHCRQLRRGLAQVAVQAPVLRAHGLAEHEHQQARPGAGRARQFTGVIADRQQWPGRAGRTEEHTSELQSLMRSSYAVLCLKHKTDVTHPLTNMTRSTNTQ